MSIKRLISFCTILIFHSIFISFKPGYAISQYIQTLCALLEIVFLFRYVGWAWSKYRTIILLIILYMCSMCVSTYLSYNNLILPRNVLANQYVPLKYSLQLFGIMLLVSTANKYNMANIVYRNLYVCTLLYVIVTDVYIITLPSNTDSSFIFLFGNKFWIAYLNILLATFIYYNQLKKHRDGVNDKLIIFFILGMMFCVLKHADSTTGCLGTALFFIFILFKKKLYYLFDKRCFLTSSILILDIGFFVFLIFILSLPYIQYFIVDILHKDLSLNGRTYIYELLQQIIFLRPWFGFGCDNGYKAMVILLDTNNAQNGLIYNYLDIGLIGCIIFILLLYNISKYRISSIYNFPIYIYLYLMILFSTYEITLSNSFLCISFLLLLNTYKNNHSLK